MRRIIVVGASIAGVHAAEALREQGFGGEITLVSAEHVLPYDRPPLSKAALATPVPEEDLLLRPEGWYAEREVELILGTAVTRLNVPAQSLDLADGTRLGYDGLVLATGSIARMVAETEGDIAEIQMLRTAHDSRRLREKLIPGSHLVVIGGGFIGLEIASSARACGVEVTVVEIGAAPLAGVFGAEVGGWFATLHERHGVEIRCRESVRTLRRDGQRLKVYLGGGDVLVADTVAAGLGAIPATEWLRGSGLDLVRGGVVCDERLRTSAPGIVVAGDIAHWHNKLFGEHMRIEHWTNAVEQGRYAALSLLEAEAGPYIGLPYFWTDQFDAGARTIGRVVGPDRIYLHQADDDSLVALYGRNGMLRGAVCVNAPRALLTCRRALMARVPWHDAVTAVGG